MKEELTKAITKTIEMKTKDMVDSIEGGMEAKREGWVEVVCKNLRKDVKEETQRDEGRGIVNYLVGKLQEAIENPTLQAKVQGQIQQLQNPPNAQQERGLDRPLNETSKKGASLGNEEEMHEEPPIQSAKEGASHQELSKERDGSETLGTSESDAAPRRRRASHHLAQSRKRESCSETKEESKMFELLNEFEDVFTNDIPSELPPTKGQHDHTIELLPGSSPPNKPSYRVSQAQQEEITRQVNELVGKGMVNKEKHRHKANSFDSSTSDTSEAEKTSNNTSESEEEDKKKTKKDSWTKKFDEMSKRISEISRLRGTIEKAEKWCTKCQSKSHTSDDCTQCNYCKAFGHMWNNCKIKMHQLKEGKDLTMIAYASMEAVPVGTDQQQNTATAGGYSGTSGYNGRGRDRGRGRGSTGDFKRNFNCYKCGNYVHFAAQCLEPKKPTVLEVKHKEPVPIRAVTKSTVIIEELPNDPPVSSKLNPKAKEWDQQRSTWKEKGKAKEFDE
ncbi:hypothetical protein L7F22_061474 [Adiantum nelumboides]|nr:hypothetical protein [Adiantum nelumboides]